MGCENHDQVNYSASKVTCIRSGIENMASFISLHSYDQNN